MSEIRKLLLVRELSNANETVGVLSIDGKFECCTLEDEYRSKKVWGETRIPAGIYNVVCNNEFGKNKKYKKRFPDLHKGMLHIKDVPNFKYILIHIGNTDRDTAGCILVGKKYYKDAGKFHLMNSTDAYAQLYSKIIDSTIGGNVTLEIVDGDRKK